MDETATLMLLLCLLGGLSGSDGSPSVLTRTLNDLFIEPELQEASGARKLDKAWGSSVCMGRVGMYLAALNTEC